MGVHTKCMHKASKNEHNHKFKSKKGDVTIMLDALTSKISALTTTATDAVDTVMTDYSNYTHAGAEDMLRALCLGVVIEFLISLVYILTHRKGGYSQSYVLTVLMLPPIVAIVLVMINSTASALSLAGVFTLCRYRTVPADPKDVTYVFFAMAAGVICGISEQEYWWSVFVFFAVIAAVLIIVEFSNYGRCKSSTMTLKITIPENLNYAGLFDDTLTKNTTAWKLKRVKTTSYGSLFELVYVIQMKDNVDQKQFIDDLRKLNGNLTVILSLFRYEDMVFDTKD